MDKLRFIHSVLPPSQSRCWCPIGVLPHDIPVWSAVEMSTQLWRRQRVVSIIHTNTHARSPAYKNNQVTHTDPKDILNSHCLQKNIKHLKGVVTLRPSSVWTSTLRLLGRCNTRRQTVEHFSSIPKPSPPRTQLYKPTADESVHLLSPKWVMSTCVCVCWRILLCNVCVCAYVYVWEGESVSESYYRVYPLTYNWALSAKSLHW